MESCRGRRCVRLPMPMHSACPAEYICKGRAGLASTAATSPRSSSGALLKRPNARVRRRGEPSCRGPARGRGRARPHRPGAAPPGGGGPGRAGLRPAAGGGPGGGGAGGGRGGGGGGGGTCKKPAAAGPPPPPPPPPPGGGGGGGGGG